MSGEGAKAGEEGKGACGWKGAVGGEEKMGCVLVDVRMFA